MHISRLKAKVEIPNLGFSSLTPRTLLHRVFLQLSSFSHAYSLTPLAPFLSMFASSVLWPRALLIYYTIYISRFGAARSMRSPLCDILCVNVWYDDRCPRIGRAKSGSETTREIRAPCSVFGSDGALHRERERESGLEGKETDRRTVEQIDRQSRRNWDMCHLMLCSMRYYI